MVRKADFAAPSSAMYAVYRTQIIFDRTKGAQVLAKDSRKTKRGFAFLLLSLGQLMCILDISIVNIAIPSIQRELNLANASLHWIVTAYVLTYGGFLLVGGRLGDLFGRRRMFLIGLSLFTLASAIGGMSGNLAMLVLSRAGQGVGGAIITPTVMSFVAGLYPEGEKRNRAMGLLGAIGGAGYALGLILGGLLTSTVGWRWVFYINLPIGILVIIASLWALPETKREQKPINIPGAIVATSALALLTYTMSVSDPRNLLSFRMLALIAGSAALFYLFFSMERRTEHPLIPRGLFKHASFVRALLSLTVFGAIIGPGALFLTLYLQNINHLDPLLTGLSYLPQEIALPVAATLAGRYVGRFGTRNVLVVSLLSFAVGAAWLVSLDPAGDYVGTVLPGLIFFGIGIGSGNVAGMIAATEGLPQHMHGASTGIWNTGLQVGTALGLAVLTAIAEMRTATLMSTSPEIDLAVATVAGYRLAFVLAAAVALLGIAAVFFVGRRQLNGAPALTQDR